MGKDMGKATMKSTPKPDDRLLTVDEAAVFLAISPKTLWTITNRRDVACVRIGGAVRYQKSDLLAFVEARRVGAT